MMGLPWFRQGEIIETATRELTDVISKKLVNAKASTFKFWQVPASVALAANDAEFALVA